MAPTHATRFTAKEYLALEAVAEVRHEFTGGQIVAMAGAELEHNQICQNARSELAAALGARRLVDPAATSARRRINPRHRHRPQRPPPVSPRSEPRLTARNQ
jgi:hypothetical protein